MRRAIALVLLLGVLLGTTAAGGGCENTGAGNVSQGDPTVDRADGAKKVKFRVTWEPADAAVHIWTAIDGQPVDHGVKRGGSWGMDGIAKSSAGLDARALNHPESLHCDMQVGWSHYEGWAAPDKGDWTCFSHWPMINKALGPLEANR